ncbi:MAG: ABC transporter substrate-binding protein [Candidatus Bipolaricaulota bacterium]|nr:iron ABC transporter substrate-binding protein [Candidatus Bipolaricaulota bacterium]MBS3792778.1 iron ABC transporter substrate-binding protein [Candidatus Bipolaricaulota bacterium]
MRKKLCLISVLIVAVVFFGATSFSGSESGETITVTDMTGRKVEVPEKVDEVVGLEAGALRLIIYLNCVYKVVGVENIEKQKKHHTGRPYILAHPELAELPSVGPTHGGDPELITALDPDVIFWTYATAGDANDLQNQTGIPVIALTYGDLGAHKEAIYDGLNLMGKVLNAEDRAKKLIQYIESTIQDLKDRTKDIPPESKPEAYVGAVSYRGSHGIVSTEPKYAPFQFVNAKNPAADLGSEHVIVSSEKLVEWDPEIIFIDEGGYSLAMEDLKNPKFKTLQAVRDGNLYGILPQSYYTHNFGTVLADSYYIGKVLYPGRFEDVNPEEKADEIYKVLVGGAVYDKMKEDFGGFKKIDPSE